MLLQHVLGQHDVFGQDAGGLGDGDACLGLVVVGIGQQQLADRFAQGGLGVVLQAQVVALPEQAHQGIDDGFDQCGFDRHGCSLPWTNSVPAHRLNDRERGAYCVSVRAGLHEQPVAPPIAGDEIARWLVRQPGIFAQADMPAAKRPDRLHHLAVGMDRIFGIGVAMQHQQRQVLQQSSLRPNRCDARDRNSRGEQVRPQRRRQPCGGTPHRKAGGVDALPVDGLRGDDVFDQIQCGVQGRRCVRAARSRGVVVIGTAHRELRHQDEGWITGDGYPAMPRPWRLGRPGCGCRCRYRRNHGTAPPADSVFRARCVPAQASGKAGRCHRGP